MSRLSPLAVAILRDFADPTRMPVFLGEVATKFKPTPLAVVIAAVNELEAAGKLRVRKPTLNQTATP